MKNVFLTVLTLTCLAFGADGGEKSDALKSLTGDLEFRSKTRTEIEYCMDNVCDLVSSPSKKQQVADFAFLYFFYGSSREGVPDPNLDKQRQYAHQLLAKYMKSSCSALADSDRVKCVLRALASQNRIRTYVVRYDEGKRHVMAASLQSLKIVP